MNVERRPPSLLTTNQEKNKSDLTVRKENPVLAYQIRGVFCQSHSHISDRKNIRLSNYSSLMLQNGIIRAEARERYPEGTSKQVGATLGMQSVSHGVSNNMLQNTSGLKR